MATDDDGKNIIFGECKFWKNPVGINILNALEKKAALVDWNRTGRKEWYVLFSISGFTDELKQLVDKRKNLLLIEG